MSDYYSQAMKKGYTSVQTTDDNNNNGQRGSHSSWWMKVFDPVMLTMALICAIMGEVISALVGSNVLSSIFLPICSGLDFIITRSIAHRNAGKENDRFLYFMSAGVFACFVSDIILGLVWVNPLLFLIGTGTFGIAHCFFIAGLSCNGESVMFRRLFPVLIYGAIMIGYLYFSCTVRESIPIAVAVAVYALLEMTTVWRAFARINFRTNVENVISQWFVALGALSLLVSDTMLIYGKYCPNYPQGGLLGTYFMSFYYIAILLISLGANRYDHPINFVKNMNDDFS